MALLHLQTYKRDQDLIGDAIDAENEPKLRAEIKRNFYDFQSYAKVSAWTDEGWKVIATWPITAMDISGYKANSRDSEIWVDAMKHDLKELLANGRAFFRGSNSVKVGDYR